MPRVWSQEEYDNAIRFLEDDDTTVDCVSLLVQLAYPPLVGCSPLENTADISRRVLNKLGHLESNRRLSELSINFSDCGPAHHRVDRVLAACLRNTKVSHIKKLTLTCSERDDLASILQGLNSSNFHLESLHLLRWGHPVYATSGEIEALAECLVKKKSSLRHLCIDFFSLGGANPHVFLGAVSQLQQLESLSLHVAENCPRFFGPLWDGLSKMQSLKHLRIDDFSFDHFSSGPMIPNLTHLKHLEIRDSYQLGVQLTSRRRAAIAHIVNHCPNLETLEAPDPYYSLDISIALAKNRMRFNFLVQGKLPKPLWPLLLARQDGKTKFDEQANLQVLFQFLKEKNPDLCGCLEQG